MAKFDIKSYIKNVVKSTGYIMTDVAKETNPIVTDFINTNSDTIKDMYSFVKDFKRNVGQKKEALADNEYAQLAKDTVHNFFDDIKTGKFYNVERSKSAEDELMRSMMGDDFNMDFDTDDWDFDENSSSSGFGDLDENNSSDSLSSSDMDIIGGKITEGISKSNILSADYVVKASRANTKKVIANNEILFGKVNTSISAVNASIASLGKAIIPALSTHVDNSSKFYAKTTEQLTEMNEYIKKIYEILDKNVDIKEKEKKARKASTFADSVGYSGIVNLSGWGKSIKKNIESQLGALTMVTSMLQAFGGTAAIKSMVSSPVAMIASMLLSNLLTNRYGQNIKAFNSLAGGLFGKFQISLMKSKGNGVMGFIRDLLGVSPNTKHSIDTSKYNKGPKQWDGKDSKALQEVIPRQLAMIISALTGRDPEIFNYETGRWGTIKDLRSHMVKKINKIAYDSQEAFNEKFKTVSGFERASKDYKSQLTRESEVFHRYVMFHLKHMPTSVKQWDNLKKIMQKAAILEGGKGPGQISLRTFNMLKSSYLQLKDSDRLMMETNYLRARDEAGSYFEEAEEKGTYSAMLSGGYNVKSKLNKVNLITNAIDDKGHNIFFYLQNYYNQLETLITKIANNPMDPRKIKKLKRNGKYNPVTPNQLSIDSDSLVIGGDQEAIVDKNRQLAISKYNKNAEKKLQELRKAYLKDQNENIKKLKEIDKEIAKYEQLKASKRRNKKGELIDYDLDIKRLEQRKADINKERKNRFSRYMIEKTAVGGSISDDEVKAARDETWVQARNREYNERREALAREQGENYQHTEGIINKVLDDINDKIYTFLYGERRGGARQGGEEYREGLIKSITKKADDFFKNIKAKFTGVLDYVKEKFDDFKNSAFVEGFKSTFRSAKNYFLGGAATGARHIKRDGVIAVSKGEMVIPSEYNRDYHGPTNKYAQIAREASLANKWKSNRTVPFLGTYAEGGYVSLKDRIKQRRQERYGDEDLEEKRRELHNKRTKITENIRIKVTRNKAKQKTSEIVDNLVNLFKNQTDDLMKDLYGDDYKQKNKKIFDLDKYGIKMNGTNLGKTAGHATMGLLIGGLVGMPLLGAAAGAAASIVSRSETLQNKLFGEKDEEGNYKGGVFGPGLSKLLKDIAPSYAKFAAGGALAGLIGLVPGGVVGGLIAGSALKYVSDNEKVHNYLFGDAGLLGKDTDQKIKKMAPKLAIGAAALAFTGPFGLIPNMILGAGIGFVSDTERFKNEIFGYKDSDGVRQGGLIGIIKEEVLFPIRDNISKVFHGVEDYVFDNFLNPIKRLVGNLGDTISGGLKGIRDWFTGVIQDKIFGPIYPVIQGFVKGSKKVVGTLFKIPLNIVKTIGKAPGALMNLASAGLERFNIAHGWSSSNVAERDLKWRYDNKLKHYYIKNSTGIGALTPFGRRIAQNRTYDMSMASMTRGEIEEGLDSLKAYHAVVNGNKFAAHNLKKEILNRFTGDMHGKGINVGKLRKMLNDHDFEGARSYLEELAQKGILDQNKKNDYLAKLDEAEKKIVELNSGDVEEIKKKAFSFGAKLGYSEDQLNKTNKVIGRVSKDLSLFGDDKNDKATTDATGTENNTVADLLDPVQHIKTALDTIVQHITGASVKTEEEQIEEHVERTLADMYAADIARKEQARFHSPEERARVREAADIERAQEQAIRDDIENKYGGIWNRIKRTGRAIKNGAISLYKDSLFYNEGGSGSGLYRFFGGNAQLDEDGNPKTKIVTDDDGNILEYERNSRGGYELSKNPMNTIVMRAKKKAADIKEKAYKSLGNIGGFFSKFFGKKEEKKEKKKGILATLFDGIKTVGGGALGILGTLFGGLGIGSILKIGAGLVGVGFLGNFLDKHPEVADKLHSIFIGTDEKPGLVLHIRNLFKDKIIPMATSWWEKHGEELIKSLISGLATVGKKILDTMPKSIDEWLNLGDRILTGDTISSPTITIDENGNTVKTTEDKNHIKTITVTDPNGNIISTRTEETNRTPGAIVKDENGNPVVHESTGLFGQKYTNIVKNRYTRKPVTEAASRLPRAMIAKTAVNVLTGDLKKKLLGKIGEVFSNFATVAAEKAGITITKEAIEKGTEEVAEQVVKKAGADQVSKALKTTLFVLYVGGILLAVKEGWDDAPSILGIIRQPTISERCIAALLSGINAALPGLGNIISTAMWFEIIFRALKFIGVIKEDNKLEQDRKAAKEEIKRFNAEHGTTYETAKDYNKNVNGWMTFSEYSAESDKLANDEYEKQLKAGSWMYFDEEEEAGSGSGLYNFIGGKSSTSNSATLVDKSMKYAISRYYSNEKNIDPVNDITAMLEYMDVTKHPKTDGFNRIADKYKNTNMYVPMKYANYIIGSMLPFSRIINFVYSKLDKAIDTTQSSNSNISSFLSNISSGLIGNISSGVSSTGGKIASWAEGLFGKITGKSSSSTTDTSTTTDSTTTDATAGGSHVSQKGSFRKFGHSTVDENGCGPAVAATVLREYGRNATLDGAVNFANAGGYIAGASNVGTRSSYFGDIFARNGISSTYTNRKSDIRRAVNSGRPTVLLGQDRGNKSKFNSPFGPNPHYVVASGTTRNGGVVINDPELDRPAIYSKNILNKSKLGIMTGGDSGMSMADLKKDTYADANAKKATSSTTTTSSGTVDEDAATWNLFKSAGFTDAGAAALMGNLYAESGIKSNKVEYASIMKDPGKHQSNSYGKNYGFTYDDASYTAAVDKGLKEGLKGSAETNLSPKFGVIPEYEFVYMPWKVTKKNGTVKFGQNGYGLAQWTSPGRKQGLYDYIKSKNVSISDKKAQLEYLINEIKSNSDFENVRRTVTSSNDLKANSDIVLKDFEQPTDAASMSAQRLGYSEKYYNKYSGKTISDASFGSSSVLGSSEAVNINFPTYNLSDAQLKGAANIIQHEQGGIQGRYAEASLMANQVDMRDDSKATAENLISKLTSGWFAEGKSRYNAGANGSAKIEDSALKAATDVFNNGKRTLPRYVDEHDCFSDFASVDGRSTGLTKAMGWKARIANTPSWVKDRSIYKPGTNIQNVYESKWKFSLFPDDKSDAFGYTSEDLRTKHGEAHYTIDSDGNITAPEGYSSGSSDSSSSGSSDSSSGGTDFWSTIGNIFNKILKVSFGKMGKVGKALSSLFGFNDNGTTENGTSTSSASTATSSENGEFGEIQTSAGNSSQENEIIKKMNSILGTSDYSMKGARDPSKGSSDCSSTVQWVLKNAIGVNPGGTTPEILGSSNGILVDKYSSGDPLAQTSSGPNLSNLRPGDLMLYSRPTSGFSEGRKYRVGHVEMYMGDGKRAGHGSGRGPKVTDAMTDAKRYILSKRYTTEQASSTSSSDSVDDSKMTATGSGLYKLYGGKAAIDASGEYDYDDRDDGHVKPYPTGYGTPRSMIEIARSQLGVLEGGVGEKDKNGKWIPHSGNITDYGKFMGMDGQPWCASFVSWVMDKTFNGAKNKRNHALRGKPSAAVTGLWDNFKAAGEMYDTPEPGDIVIYKNGTSHTGIVETVTNGNHITTIEGNTSSGNTFDRNGGIVFRKEFTIGDGSSIANKLTGFGRPNWNAEKEFGTGSGLYRLYGGGSIPSLDMQLNKRSSDRINTLNKPFNDLNATRKKIEEEKKKQQAINIANRAKASMSWEADNEAIRKMMNANYNTSRAAASWEADNEAIRKQQNDNYYLAYLDKENKDIAYDARLKRELAAWEADQKAMKIDPTAGRNLVKFEEEYNSIINDPSAGKNSISSGSKSSGSSSSGSSGSSGSSTSSGASSSGGIGGAISTESLASMLEYLKIIAENTSNNTSIKTIVEILTSMAKIIGATNQISAQEQENINKSNTEDDVRREKIQSELNSVMSTLRQLAQSA